MHAGGIGPIVNTCYKQLASLLSDKLYACNPMVESYM